MTETLPEDIDTKRSLHPSVVLLWRLQRLVRLITFGLPMAIGLAIGAGMLAGYAVGVVVGVLLVVINLVTTLVWPGLEYGAFRFAMREQDLWVQSGVLFRRWSTIPFSRIQHVDTRQGPIERMFGLRRLQIYTASGVTADGSIPGLADQEADDIRDHLSRLAGVAGEQDDGV